MRQIISIVLFVFLGLSFGQNPQRLILATTTSTENSGLLEVLIPPFEAAFGIQVDVVAVGSGAALALGRNGDADVLLVHAPEAEIELVNAGYAVNRRYVMYNDFIIVGPGNDPANIRNAESVDDAFRRLAAAGASFISRGDDSGTHKKELELWESSQITPDWPRYQEIGQGMEAALVMASEQRSYTLSDRGTFLAAQDKLELEILFAGDDSLFNPYHVMAVNPTQYPESNYFGAMAFIAYLTSPATQGLIADFKVNKQNLFFPAANTVPFD